MTTDPSTIGAASPDDDKAHLTRSEAKEITRDEGDTELTAFVAALQMQRPVSTDKAALLLEHVIKETMSATVGWLEGQMRADHWDQFLSEGETLTDVAQRAHKYLESNQGVELFNLFAKTFAKTTGEMFD
ncbi:hypothetical protein Q4S45_04635 [Massilia sp. R2A-15]|uniref:hypothetical protein n=1 Tax=Massilia sp. R2A-15 TaxID=3064278 RepID=UPI002737677D|nr:hypothetical protein [Massilia sp. R2A-15]WLI90413.1 hypothetical protein Q4S45_04635 [Massilia sp. R2A-15]